MVSAEVLRRYAFFAGIDNTSLHSIAIISEEVRVKPGDQIFTAGQQYRRLYLLIEGNVESYLIEDSSDPEVHKEFYLADINPGEVFGLNSLVEPFAYSNTARASRVGKMLRIDAAALMRLCDENPRLGFQLMQNAARTALERLQQTRIQLAACR